MSNINGLIVKSIGGIYTVEASDGCMTAGESLYEARARGIFRKRGVSPACGDFVAISENAPGSYVIEEIKERRNELIRPPLANLDLLLYVASTAEPAPDVSLIDKFIAVCEYKGISSAIVITKPDKGGSERLTDIYKKTSIPVFVCDNTTGAGSKDVRDFISGKLSAFTGNTGVGKSSLINCMFPGLKLSTGEISQKLGRGRHTTRHVELFRLPGGGYIADTPGFSTFDTNRYDVIYKEDLAHCFREFEPYTDRCRYRDCSHTSEEGCAVIEAVRSGEIASSRHRSYVMMYEEASELKKWEHKKQRGGLI